jgi:hypothetical protein
MPYIYPLLKKSTFKKSGAKTTFKKGPKGLALLSQINFGFTFLKGKLEQKH